MAPAYSRLRWQSRHAALGSIFVVLVGLAGLVFVVGPTVTQGRIPGDIGDARFNSYLLEHFYRWMTGSDRHFWSACIFYPYPLAIAFSDNFLGDGIVYALFRSAGWARDDAFRLWYTLGYAVNFAAASYAGVRLGYSRPAAALGAFLFTFGMPVSAQEGHAQLVYRFGVPLATLAILKVRRRNPLWQLGLAGFWVTWQFYCSIYIGYFLALLLVALVLANAVCSDAGPLAGLLAVPVAATRTWRTQPLAAKAAFAVMAATMAALLVVLFVPYIEASHLYGFERQWSEIATMLPRPASYLYSNNSLIWPASGNLFDALPMRQEQAMFIGVAPFVVVAVGVCLRAVRRTTRDPLFAPLALAIGLLVLATLWVHGFSFYRPFASLPGSDAIRAVSRIVVVMLFPVGLLLASGFDAIATARLVWGVRAFGVTALGLLLVLEASLVRHDTSTQHEWQQRLAAVAAMLPENLPSHPILLVAPAPNEMWIFRAIDAMLLAQDHGWPTINGYSGNLPTGYVPPISCQQGFKDLAGGLALLHRRRDDAALAHTVVAVGYPGGCHDTLGTP